MSRQENPNRFWPEDPPNMSTSELRTLVEYIHRHYQRLAAITNTLSDGQLEESSAPPDRPTNGMLRLADGTLWDPGSGRGVYWFDAPAMTWRFLG